MSLASDLLVAVMASLTLAVFTMLFAAMGYGVYEIRKVRSLIQDIRESHNELDRQFQSSMAHLDLILDEEITPVVQQGEQANLHALGETEGEEEEGTPDEANS